MIGQRFGLKINDKCPEGDCQNGKLHGCMMSLDNDLVLDYLACDKCFRIKAAFDRGNSLMTIEWTFMVTQVEGFQNPPEKPDACPGCLSTAIKRSYKESAEEEEWRADSDKWRRTIPSPGPRDPVPSFVVPGSEFLHCTKCKIVIWVFPLEPDHPYLKHQETLASMKPSPEFVDRLRKTAFGDPTDPS